MFRYEILVKHKENKAMKREEYAHYIQKNSAASYFSEESDSDFEQPAPKRVKETTDLTTSEDTASALKTRLDSLEQGLNKTLESYEEKEKLRRIVTCLEADKKEILNEKKSPSDGRRYERAIEHNL